MEDEGTFSVLIGCPVVGYTTVESGLSKETAEKLSLSLQEECDYFTSAIVNPDNNGK